MSDLITKYDNEINKIFSDREQKLATMLAMKYFEEVKDKLFVDSIDRCSVYLYNGNYIDYCYRGVVKRDIIDWFRYTYDDSIFMKMCDNDFTEIFNILVTVLEKVDISTVIHVSNVESQVVNTKDGYFDLNTNEIISCERDSIYPCPFKYIITDSINEIREINSKSSDKILRFLKENESWLCGEISLLELYNDIEKEE